MKVTFLGTGTSQGIPIIGSTHPVCLSTNPKDKRLRVSVLIEWDDLSVLIDCSPDFRQQLLRTSCTKIDAVLFTHEHNDHTAGLDDLRPFYFRQGNLHIYAHERVLNALKQRFGYIFKTENKYPGVLSLETHSIQNKFFYIGQKKILPIEVFHHKLPVFGFRVGSFAYITDAKTVSDTELDKLKNLDVLVVNALRIEPHLSHFNLEEALAFIEKVSPKKAYLTHISHHLGFHDEVQKTLPQSVHLAYDQLEIYL
ncbi:beta-lactamase [Formosa sp. Hel3_A1_48]|uniref:MBL fold metallo-hydrolase n=1 Tax=Formosa sp. Hel3_A1_48 TaxID=1336795 RepID=UPI00084E282E|nr:MBL fold metallo-hydrolase [Formosa sp. Hel3_A1_48]AOR26821.1 beta-lactamase [Formosa sp. Hel3_A1_48]MDC0950287.1 MBL fold metallo-hydrolase [Flavobacteriaceae bacterium]MDG2484595.1 MBL fold metallo-hydrolase [Flavobacteriaceae bacterium]